MSTNRLNGPCIWGTPTGPCGDPNTHPYPAGALCDRHRPQVRTPDHLPGHHLQPKQ